MGKAPKALARTPGAAGGVGTRSGLLPPGVR